MATTAASVGTSATASSSAAMCAFEYTGRPPRGDAPTSRGHGPTTTPIRTEVMSTAEAASARRGAEIRAMPNTVAPTRKGTTASRLW